MEGRKVAGMVGRKARCGSPSANPVVSRKVSLEFLRAEHADILNFLFASAAPLISLNFSEPQEILRR
jgi:hypothetical protein